MIADRVEGNLLAARQEIEKLLLLHGQGPLDAEQLSAAVADSARYDVFELVDSALRGEAPRCLHILEGLRTEGVAAPVVLWAMHREVRSMARISADVAKGLPSEQVGESGPEVLLGPDHLARAHEDRLAAAIHELALQIGQHGGCNSSAVKSRSTCRIRF